MKAATRVFAVLVLLGTVVSARAVRAQDEPPVAGRGGAGTGRIVLEPEPRPYERVITAEAKTQRGLFTVHQIRNLCYYEIPPSEFGKDFLWVSLIAKTTIGVGYGGQDAGNHVVRWERHGNRVLLRSVSYEIVAENGLPVARAVEAANNDTIIMSFPVEAIGKGDAPVIDVTRLFAAEVPEFSARTRLRARAFDINRSFIEKVTAFPQNIEVEATQTYTSGADTGAAAAAPAPAPGRGAPQGMRGASATVLMHFSMVKLPENKMMPRIFDDRVGYFSVTQQDFGQDEHRAPRRTYITRWRLEKKDPSAAVSDPVKPIIYYIDPATPMKWRPWIRKAIEDWQPAFLEAGFRNGIIAKDPPTKEEDPTWSPEDVRNSVIRWLPSTTENAVGPHIHDPRTGEILNADIQLYQNVMNLATDWYFVQVGPLDPRAAKLPLPDDLMGRLIEYVVAHEVGHTLGFQHNMKSSSMYAVDKIRNAEWLHKMGHVATLMDYSRYNYVAQPEDHIPPADLIPGIGPYDKWATHWGYAPIPGAKSPDDETKTLDEWARQQDTTPWFRFTTERSAGTDPGENTEAVGDADAVYSTGMGMRNLHRVMDMLLPATTTKPEEDYDRLTELYGRVLGQWTLEMNHVAVIVGSVDSQNKHIGQAGVQFTPTSRERQTAAVRFLNENALKTPTWLIRPDLLRRMEPVGVMARIRTAQLSVLNRLLQDQRIDRMIELEAMDSAKSYHPAEFLAEVRHGVWSELAAPSVSIDAYRRNLQNGYIESMAVKVNERTAGLEDVRALLRAELKMLSGEITAAMAKSKDAATRAHLEAAKDSIMKALDPKVPFEPATAAPAGGRGGRGGTGANGTGTGRYGSLPAAAPKPSVFEAKPETLGCWPDYGIGGSRNQR